MKILCTLLMILSAVNLAAKEVPKSARAVFDEIRNPILDRSVIPYVDRDFFVLKKNSYKISEKDRNFALSNMKDWHSPNLSTLSWSDTTGSYKRQYAVFKNGPDSSIFLVTIKNTLLAPEMTEIHVLCQEKRIWVVCTKAVMPQVSIQDFVKEGEVLDAEAASFFYVDYSLNPDLLSICVIPMADKHPPIESIENGIKKRFFEASKYFNKLTPRPMCFGLQNGKFIRQIFP